MSERSDIQLIGEDLQYGETTREDCPYCGHAQTFTITRLEEGIVFNCYRASCQRAHRSRGFIGVDRALRERARPKPGREVRFYEGETREISPAPRRALENMFNISRADICAAGILYAPASSRYVFPVRDPYGRIRGEVHRSFAPRTSPKSILYPHHGTAPMQAWYHDGTFHALARIVIVEDTLSAMRVARVGCCGLAILGTSVGADKQEEIMSVKPREIIVALDADAIENAYMVADDLKLLCPSVRVAHLDEDLKDLPDDDAVKEVLAT